MPPDSIISDRTTEPVFGLRNRVQSDLGKHYNFAWPEAALSKRVSSSDSTMSTNDSASRAPLELRSFLDRVPALAWSALPDGSLDFFNQRFRDYTGLSSGQLYGSEWKSAVHR